MLNEAVLTFGPFAYRPAERALLKDGDPVRIGSRALDLLDALLSRPGDILTAAELIARVWPNVHVEETNLRVQVAALRKALGDGDGGRCIANIPGRGYTFAAPVERHGTAASAARAAPIEAARRNRGQLFGRTHVIDELALEIGARRLVTLVGPGGIGKTSVARALIDKLSGSHQGGAVFVDLGAVADGDFVVGAVAAACGVTCRSDAPMTELARALASRDLLLVLDCCEHVIEAAAATAEQLVAQGYGVNVVATSREPLRVEGEWVHRLSALAVPGTDAPITAEAALGYSAVELFVERASAALGGYALTDEDVPLVAGICRRLDGIALAIELAAGRVESLGIRGIAQSLETSFGSLTRGRRTALPRHRTLRATLDWSYGTLSEAEGRVLACLAVFVGGFRLSAARAVAASDGIGIDDVEDAIASLAAKSLVSLDLSGQLPRYRLLDMTREYALEKLRLSGEAEAIVRRHAMHYRDVLSEGAARAGLVPAEEWLHLYGREVGNLRAALEWAWSDGGDAALAVALTVASVPLWYRLSLVDEALDHVRAALRNLEQRPSHDAHARMHLYAALGWPQMRASSGLPSGGAAWREVLRLAEELDDLDFQLRALWALWLDEMNSGRPQEALATSVSFQDRARAAGAANDALLGERLAARSLHLIGDQTSSRVVIERVLASYVEPEGRPNLTRFQYDQRISMRITLARALWFTGAFDAALREADDIIADALALDHQLTLCVALADAACPLNLLAGDLRAAERYIDMLADKTARQFLDVWNAYAECFAGELIARGGRPLVGAARMEKAVANLERSGFIQYQAGFVGSHAAVLIGAGMLDRAEGLIATSLARCRASGENWYCPELLRLQGDILLARPDTTAAAEQYRAALSLARGQAARSWELRAATSLAVALRALGRPDKGAAELAAVLDTLPPTADVADVLTARALLGELAGSRR